MIKQYEIKIKIHNFDSESVNNILSIILMGVDNNSIVVNYITLRKERRLLNFGVYIAFFYHQELDIMYDAINVIIRGFYSEKNPQKSEKIKLTKDEEKLYFLKRLASDIDLEVIKGILNNSIIYTKTNPNANAEIESNKYILAIKDGMMENLVSKVDVSPSIMLSSNLSSRTIIYNIIKTKICPKCHTKNDESAIYCKYCGAKLK